MPKLDKTQLNSKWFEALSAAGVTLAAQPVDRQHPPNCGWPAGAPATAAERRGHAVLSSGWEGNLLAARQEVDKLALLFPAGATLTLADLQSAVANVARYDVFQLSEAWLS